MEIKVLFRTGAGENVQGRTGNAGIAYMAVSYTHLDVYKRQLRYHSAA